MYVGINCCINPRTLLKAFLTMRKASKYVLIPFTEYESFATHAGCLYLTCQTDLQASKDYTKNVNCKHSPQDISIESELV